MASVRIIARRLRFDHGGAAAMTTTRSTRRRTLLVRPRRMILLPQRRGLAALSPAIQARLQSMTERHAQILDEITNQSTTTASDTTSSSPSSSSSPEQLGKELSSLSVAASLHDELQALDAEEGSYRDLLDDPELRAECRTELRRLAKDRVRLEARITDAVLALRRPRDAAAAEDDDADAIIEVRAGTGGEEAGLFANELLQSYVKTARALRWKAEILSQAKTDLGGIREASVLVSGRNAELELPATATITTDDNDDIDDTDNETNNNNISVSVSPYGAFKFESGVHRVQRVPINDTRIHTSACSVAVLPSLDNDDSSNTELLPLTELRIDVMRASGAGGQHVNTTNSAVRVTHLPTGLTASIQDERSQHKNKAKALKLIAARVRDRQRAEAEQARGATRSSLLGGGDRSERIRTFNYPQDRVTDHRCKESRHGIEALLNGGSGGGGNQDDCGLAVTFWPYLKALQRDEQLRQLDEEHEEKLQQEEAEKQSAATAS